MDVCVYLKGCHVTICALSPQGRNVLKQILNILHDRTPPSSFITALVLYKCYSSVSRDMDKQVSESNGVRKSELSGTKLDVII